MAVSLADRFIINLIVQGIELPCPVVLALTCLLVSAKISEHLRPKFELMNDLLITNYGIKVNREDFLMLEKDLLIQLSFDLQFVSPLSFLERYERLFEIDVK